MAVGSRISDEPMVGEDPQSKVISDALVLNQAICEVLSHSGISLGEYVDPSGATLGDLVDACLNATSKALNG